MRAALFGGSFDPPHLGHDAIVKSALKDLDIDILFIMPTWKNPFKTTFSAPPLQRYEWAKKLWGKIPKVKVNDYEISRHKPVPSIETVMYLNDRYPIDSLYLIIGADNLKNLTSWKNYDKLRNEVTFVVASRDDEEIPKDLKKLAINVNISSSNLRESPSPDFIPVSIREDVLRYYNFKENNER